MIDRIEEFIIDAREHLGIVEESLLALEKPSGSVDASACIDRCFRSIHSIKGDAGFLGLSHIHELAHAMESLLSGTHPGNSPRVIELLLAARDRLAVLIDDPGRGSLIEISDILAQLRTGGIEFHRTSIDVDLTELQSSYPGSLVDFIRQTWAKGKIRHGQIQLDACDLRMGLPTGAVRWTAALETSAGPDEFVPTFVASATSDSSQAILLSADLTAWSQTHRGLSGPFRELASVARIRAGQIEFPAVDLRRSLPSGRVIWSGECETSLSPSELTRRFGFAFDSPKPLQAADGGNSYAAMESPTTSSRQDRPQPAADLTSPAALPPIVTPDKPTTLRIQVELLDRMMTLVGELTLVRNQSLLAFADEDGAQRAIIQRLNSVTSELQDVTLRSRMQPVGILFNKFPRMVRDLARQLGKQVEIDLQGREVEMDKTILEQLGDPLMHLIRNSVDHGIEMPEERIAKGKSGIGHILLSATHEDGQIQIHIRDDGRGIDSQAVKAKALSLMLKSEAELDRMSARELFSLILLPGFSTAKKVTEVSGRGVGMDVVKTNIEQLEGTVSIDSTFGVGCETVLRLPLTLAIIPCLIVTVDEERFAVPQRDLEEVVCLHPQSTGRIEQAFDTEVYRLRETLLPIVRLSEVLRRKRRFTPADKSEILAAHAADQSAKPIEYILVLRSSGRRFGLLVDEVRGTQEIVVKPMHPSMKRVGIFTGATIMGDGRVALITDAEGISEHAQQSFAAAIEAATTADGVRDASQAHRVLLFEYGPDEQFALPLVQIRRVEMITPSRIERVGDREYVTVDGVSTRVLRLDHVINASSLKSDPPLMSLILPKFVQQPMGILVSRIVDTESLALDLQAHADEGLGILGSTTVRDRLTLFLEMHYLSERLFGAVPVTPPEPGESTDRRQRLLLIDDTAFFREVIKRYLGAEGYEIVTAVQGQDALNRLSAGPDFDLIVSDIEMPVMDGWKFAREVRRRGIKTKMLALTSLSGEQNEAKAMECGFDGYEVKLDHDRLVRKVRNLLAAQEVMK